MLRKSMSAALLCVGVWGSSADSIPKCAAGEGEPIPVPVLDGEPSVPDELPFVPGDGESPLGASAMSPELFTMPPASPFAGSLLERPKLTGNWLGTRDYLAQHGIAFDVYTTQFYQGVTSGGLNNNWDYAGRVDYLLNIDGEKAGLMKGSFITLHGETRYGNTVDSSSTDGDSINPTTGALMPSNVAMLFPLPTGTVTALTAVKYTQFLSENLAVFGGKLNLLDELKQPYAAGRGVDAFMNTGLALPVVLARTTPYSTLGVGFAVLENLEPVFTFSVLDTNNTPTTTGFESFFDNGATLLMLANRPVTLFGLPGHQGIGGTYSTGTYNDLSPTAYFDPEAGLQIRSGAATGSWSVFYLADQALYVDPENPQRSWGLFANVGAADNGPSPVRWSAYGGVGGSSPLVSRPRDTFGVGYFYVGYSDPVQQFAPRLLPIGNDQGVELFYNVAVTPWCRITPDLQILSPARERTLPPPLLPQQQEFDTAVVFGLRARIDF